MIMLPQRRTSIYSSDEKGILPSRVIEHLCLPLLLILLDDLQSIATGVHWCYSLSSIRHKPYWIHREALTVCQAPQYLQCNLYGLSLPDIFTLYLALSIVRPWAFSYLLDRHHPASLVCLVLSADEPLACSTFAALLVAQWFRLLGSSHQAPKPAVG
jgi:hypothetical protein